MEWREFNEMLYKELEKIQDQKDRVDIAAQMILDFSVTRMRKDIERVERFKEESNHA